MTEKIKDVHTEHCCAIHGCKYMDDDCTVTVAAENKEYVQSFPCEDCCNNGNDTLEKALQVIHPTMGTFANHIILYAKNWYGSSYNGEEDQVPFILNDLRKLQARFSGIEEKHIGDNDVRGFILEAFDKYVTSLMDRKEGLAEAFGWRWGRKNRPPLNDRDPIIVMIGKLSIVKGEYAYLSELYPDICFDRDRGKKCEECHRSNHPNEWNYCRIQATEEEKETA